MLLLVGTKTVQGESTCPNVKILVPDVKVLVNWSLEINKLDRICIQYLSWTVIANYKKNMFNKIKETGYIRVPFRPFEICEPPSLSNTILIH